MKESTATFATSGCSAAWLFSFCYSRVSTSSIFRQPNRLIVRKKSDFEKVVGSLRSSLVRQFLTESLVYSFVSFALADTHGGARIAIFQFAFRQTTRDAVDRLAIDTVLLSGSGCSRGNSWTLSAFYLSAFKPSDVLKGSVSRGSRKAPGCAALWSSSSLRHLSC